MEEFFRDQYGGVVDKIMCTPACPCDVAHEAKYKDATTPNGAANFRETNIDEYGYRFSATQYRVLNMGLMNGDSKQTLNGGNDANLAWDMTASQIPLFWKAKDETTVLSFKECYTKTLKAKWEKDEPAKAEQFAYALQFFSELEDGMDCSGACAKPLFGIGRSIAEGPPTRDCVAIIVESLSALTAPGVVCLITFFVLVCATIGSFPICYGFDKEDIMRSEP
jgi:hypothetical protein